MAFDYQFLMYGWCPKCEDCSYTHHLKLSDEYVYCTRGRGCTFKMSREKYEAKFNRKGKNGSRSWGYYRVKHNSVPEHEKMEDICLLN